MSIGIIIGSRVSSVLETVLRFGCGISVIGVAIELVTYIARSYRKLAGAEKKDIMEYLKKKDNPTDTPVNASASDSTTPNTSYDEYVTRITVQWHVEILSALVMMGIFIVACELAVGDFTASLVQSLSVGIGFGLKELMQDAVYGVLAMTQGYGYKEKFMHISDKPANDSTIPSPRGFRIYQAHLTHVVLRPCDTKSTEDTDSEKAVTYVVKRWTDFYNVMQFQEHTV